MNTTHITRVTRLTLLCLAALLLMLWGRVTIQSRASTDIPKANPIQLENQQPGTQDWQLGGAGNHLADDINKQIKGYASATSVNGGQTIQFYVTVSPVQTYTLDIFRMGWYTGNRGRLVSQSGVLGGLTQPACPQDPTTGLTECHWTASYSLTVPANWTSGIYLGKLTNAQNYQNYIVFVVRNDGQAADLLYEQPVNTYQAYNNYPNDKSTGKSLYDSNSFGPNTILGSPRAAKVSYNRPYADNGSGQFDNYYSQWTYEIFLVSWLERMGYDLSYATNVDIHANPTRLLNFKGFISAGHDEYWSKEMFDAVEKARDRGVNAVFFSANAIDQQVRYEPASDGTPNRTVVAYKDPSFDPVSDPALKTIRFVNAGRTQQTLVGTQYTTFQSAVPTQTLILSNTTKPSTAWVFANTTLSDGATVPKLLGYEIDAFLPEQHAPLSTTYTILAASPFIDAHGVSAQSNAAIYQAPSGAWVFSTGTTSWSWALDYTDRLDPRIQQMTKNILDRFTQSNPPVPLPPTPTPVASPTPAVSATPGATVTPGPVCSQIAVPIQPHLAIPDNNKAFSCEDLIAPNIGTLNTVTLQVGISHTYVSDLVLQLRSPDGKALTLMNRVTRPALTYGSGASLWSTYPIGFAASGVDAEKMGLTLARNQVVCRDDKQCVYAADPDSDTSSTLASMTGFVGGQSAGTWKLCIADESPGDVGTLDTATLNLVCQAPLKRPVQYLPMIQKQSQ